MEDVKLCPYAHCRAPMVKQDHRGVIIDVCERDGAVALDPGELPLIVSQVSSTPGYRPIPPANFASHRASYSSHGHHSHHGHGRHHNDDFFDELFDGS